MNRRLLPAIALVVALGGCAPAPPPTGDEPIRILTPFPVAGLDPVDDAINMTKYGIAETLMRSRDDGTLEPLLLESLDRLDERRWRLTLREGVRFHNGNPLDADALAALITRELAADTAAADALPGAGVEVTGDREVVVSTAAAQAELPNTLAQYGVFDVYDVAAVDAGLDTDAEIIDAGIYTGPYRPTRIDEQRLVAERHDDHWAGTPPLSGVEVRFVTDEQARLQGVRNGEADVALYPPTAARDLLDGDPDTRFVTAESSRGGFRIQVNQNLAPFDERDVRRAFLAAIDYRSIAVEVLGEPYEPAHSMYPARWPFAVHNQITDLAEANRLLDAAGWPAGADGVRARNGQRLSVVLLTAPRQPDAAPQAVALQAQVRAAGFEVTIRSVEDLNAAMEQPAGWNAAVQSESPINVSSGGVQAPLRTYLHSDGDRNHAGVALPELDALIDALPETFDEAARTELLRDVQDLVIAEEAATIFLSHRRVPEVVGPRFAERVPSPTFVFVTHETAPSG